MTASPSEAPATPVATGYRRHAGSVLSARSASLRRRIRSGEPLNVAPAMASSPFALLQEIRLWFDGPLILSGAIANGGAVLAAQAAGADLAYVGSPFIATEEANAPDGYKQAIVSSGAADIVYTDFFTGVHGNYIRSSIESAGLDPDNLGDAQQMKFGSDGSAKSKAWRDIWGCGQGIGVIDRVAPAGELVATLAKQYAAAKTRLCSA